MKYIYSWECEMHCITYWLLILDFFKSSVNINTCTGICRCVSYNPPLSPFFSCTVQVTQKFKRPLSDIGFPTFQGSAKQVSSTVYLLSQCISWLNNSVHSNSIHSYMLNVCIPFCKSDVSSTCSNNIVFYLFCSTDYGKNFKNVNTKINGAVIQKHIGLQRNPHDPKKVCSTIIKNWTSTNEMISDWRDKGHIYYKEITV